MGGDLVTLFLAGDVMLGRGVDQILPHPGDPKLSESYIKDARAYVELAEAANGVIPSPVDFSWPWGDALEVLAAAAPDARILNLETAVTQSDESVPGNEVHYRMHPANLPALAAAQPHVCALANNHVLDYDRRGLEETLDALADAGLRSAGAGRDADEARRPAIVPVTGGRRVLVFSVGMASSGIPGGWAATAQHGGVDFVAEPSDAAAAGICARLRPAKRPGDIVVVSVHWGSNWGYLVPRDQIRFGHALIDGGADVVHGHSSHHPRPLESYRGKLITHGCGDLINDYEGIGGYEEYRDDLRLLYFVTVDPDDGRFHDVRIAAMRSRRMRLERATVEDSRWVQDVLSRISGAYGSRVERNPDDTLTVRPSQGPAAGVSGTKHATGSTDRSATHTPGAPSTQAVDSPGSGIRTVSATATRRAQRTSLGPRGPHLTREATMYFTDRTDAGRRLAAQLHHLKGQDLVVVGLPRGGVPVAAQIAEALGAPLDVCLVRKLGVPFQPELAMGAIGEEGVRVINEEVMRATGVTDRDLTAVEEHERGVLEQRARRYRGERQPARYEGRTVLVVDDGVATGSTALAACRIARARGASRIVLAVPVAPRDWSDRLGGEADEGVCLHTPRQFYAIGQFYEDFGQTSDEEVTACLEHNRAAHATSDTPPAAGSASPEHDSLLYDREIRMPAGGAALDGRLTLPRGVPGVVLFAHGSGSSRKSPRNRFVATGLNRAGLGTLLFDLLTEAEAENRDNVFDTALLARRLTQATEWLREQPDTQSMKFGYFGASTGAAAALWAAAEPAADVAAVVSRGGRPDLAGPRLPEVKAPTLLIVGGRDHVVLDLNRQAAARLSCEHQLAVVPGATHLFEEPGTLESVTELATDWFSRHLA